MTNTKEFAEIIYQMYVGNLGEQKNLPEFTEMIEEWIRHIRREALAEYHIAEYIPGAPVPAARAGDAAQTINVPNGGNINAGKDAVCERCLGAKKVMHRWLWTMIPCPDCGTGKRESK